MPVDLTKVDEDTLKDIATYIHDKFTEFRKSPKRQKVKERVQDARDAYDQKVEVKDFPWKGASHRRFPLETITVDHLKPRNVVALMGKDPMLTCEDFGALNKEERVEVEEWDNYVLKNEVKIQELLDPWIHGLSIDGHKYVQLFWEKKLGKRRSYYEDIQGDPLSEVDYDALLPNDQPRGLFPFMGEMMQENVVPVHDGAKIEFIDLDDLYFPDRVYNWEEEPVIRKYFITWHDFKLYQGKQGWLKISSEKMEELRQKLYAKRPDDDEEKSLEIKDTQARDAQTEDPDAETGKLKQELLFLEGHIDWDVDGDEIEEKLICTVEYHTKEVVYLEDNNRLDPLNRKQIQPTWLFREPGTAYGYGYRQKLKEISEGASDFCNCLINSAIIAMLPWFMYEEAAGFTSQNPELVPGQGLKVKDVDKVKFPQLNPNAAVFKDFLNIYIALWERLFSISDYSLGRESEVLGKKGGTATGTLAVLQEGQIAHEYTGVTLQLQFENIYAIIHDLYYLNGDIQKEYMILGKKKVMPRKLMSKNYKLRLMSSTTSSNRHAERMEMMDALMVADRGVQLGVIDPVPVIRDALGTFKNIDIDEWVNGPMAQLHARMMAGTENQGTPAEGEVQDPFPEIVMQMLQMPPEQLVQALTSMQIGDQYRQETEQTVGEITGEA